MDFLNKIKCHKEDIKCEENKKKLEIYLTKLNSLGDIQKILIQKQEILIEEYDNIT